MAMSNKDILLEIVKEDDYVEYFLFPKINRTEQSNDNEDIYLNKCLTEVNNVVEKYSANYLWHKDKFNVLPRGSNTQILLNEEYSTKEQLPPHLYGIVHYGDNNEDEWFIVFLLLQLSKEINGLVVRVVDSDGEFLLIEAANFLPSWANPDTCEKRVYLFKGQVHIVPLNQSNMQNQIEVLEALDIINKEPLITEASTNIQNAILSRTNGYPEKIKELLHRTKLYLPVGVAAILNHKPEMISQAVIAFCNRDPIDMKACRAMKYFPPENRVYTSVTFTKFSYAMLHHSKYVPDRKIGWNLPDVHSPQYKSHNLGVRIACGFEILAAHAKNNLDSDKTWNCYLESLRDKNYFKDNLEHSQEYNNLLNKAKEYFKSQNMSTITSNVGGEILDLNRKLDYCADDFKKLENSLPEDDPESWLEISVQELDKMLTDRYGQHNFLNVNGQIDPSAFSGKLTEFLDNVSSVDGAEFPDNSPVPIRPQRGIKRNNKEKQTKVSFSNDTKPEKTTTSNNDAKVNFDPSTFTCAVQNILDLVIPEDSWDLESDSEMSEYADESDSELDKLDMSKVNTKMKQYMDQMDRELAGTTIGQSFEKKKVEQDTFDDIETFQPVDIDMTALKNILESYQSQMGAAGPASNMLGPMGVHLEPGSSSDPNVE